jgi:hypothetical protein
VLYTIIRTVEKSTVTKSSDPIEEDHGGGEDPHRDVAPVKKKKKIWSELLKAC